MTSTGGQPESHQPSEFERRRALLIGEIGDVSVPILHTVLEISLQYTRRP